jgi:hypothetical protein
MAELIHEVPLAFADEDGRRYAVGVYGARREDGLWDGWLLFAAGDGTTYRTEHDTLQGSRADLLTWAAGLEPTYLDGAFERARSPRPTGG